VNKKSAKKRAEKPLGFSRINYLLFGLAFIALVIGYMLLRVGPAEGPTSLTAAPIVLVLGYCILIPLAIIWRRKSGSKES
jgi:hypothetical protein